MTLRSHTRPARSLGVLVALGLGYDALVHLRLAGDYEAVGETITQGGLFRVEAVAALLLAAAVLLVDRRIVWVSAGLTGLAGVGAVLLYRYVDVGAIGPVPNMYEPVWFTDKSLSALAEAAVAALCVAREGIRLSAGRRARAAAGS